MAISAADVKTLRDKTGAGMMECKKALVESDGDFAKAEKILKELGLAAAAKRSGRATNEGRVFTLVSDSRAAILELGCETDFVARNKEFIESGENIIRKISEDGLNEKTPELDALVTEVVSKIKENITIARFKTLSVADDELAVDYIHGEGNIGVLVKFGLEKPELSDNSRVKEFTFDIALHIAAYNPLYLDKDAVDPTYLKEQEDIFTAQAKNLDKPDNVVQGIVKGKLNKHLAEICLLNQGFVKEEKKSVSQVMDEVSKEAGGKITIKEYVYYAVGAE
ncbi:translation elongation factor Ts [Marispirochaeta aestuarii]|uniref:translation elongation factor Ts n=1 Tax=Marispirochaeta aestuarii TaxID=1963862 RepID=UPI0029C83272|nr:translation elongation factor Ts [Marispirochaeta aestuarii]